jgi:hypothetical protein
MVATISSSKPAQVNLEVYQGDSWSQQFRFLHDTVPVDLTGLTITSSVRSSDGTLTDLVVSIIDALDGTIVIGPPTGGLTPDLYDYDIEVDDAGAITTWVYGRLRNDQDVTP